MLNWFKEKKQAPVSATFQILGADMHSHLLPGIDDGAKTMEDSLALIRSLSAMGYTRLITTPHIYKEYYPNTPDIILGKLEQVRQAVAEAQIDVTIDASAEYFLDEHFEQLMEADLLLPLPGNHLLVEMSFFAPYPKLHDVIFRLRTRGYRPILAHPERYLYYAGDIEQFENIRNYGCLLQVNLLSLIGHYGKPIKTLAFKLLERGWVDFLGTDMHHAGHAERLNTLLQGPEIARILGKYEFKNSGLVARDETTPNKPYSPKPL